MSNPKTKRQPATVATAEAKRHSDQRLVSLRLKRDDMLQVWRDAIVGHQTTINSRQKLQYDRIVSACDKILYPHHRRNKQANAAMSDCAGGNRES